MKLKKTILTAATALCFLPGQADTKLISGMDILDVWEYNYNASHWLEQANLHPGCVMYGEEQTITITSVTGGLDGADWIQTAYGSKEYDRGTIAYFTLREDAYVYILHNDAITNKPAWLREFWPSGEGVMNSAGDKFSAYGRKYNSGEVVELGGNGDRNNSMYIVAVVATVKTGEYAAAKDKVASKSVKAQKIWDIRDFGAVGDNKTINTEAIQAAIGKCSAAGGGTVYIDGGIYRTGTIVLEDNVTLWVEAGAILRGSADAADYPEIESVLPAYRAHEHYQLIFAENRKNITITGGGVIDGYSLYEGWPWKGRNNEHERPRLIRMVLTNDITIRDITLVRSANWTQYYEACKDILVENVKVRCYTGTNNQDGIDISGCSDVVIRNFDATCGDDAICIKALSMVAGENIFVDGLRSRYSNCNLVKIGTETHGNLKNVHVKNAEGWTRYTIAIEAVDGTQLENVTYENIVMHSCAAPFVIRLGDRGRTFAGGPEKAPVGKIKNVTLRNIRNIAISYSEHRGGPGIGAPVAGIPGHMIENVLIEDCDFILFGGFSDKEYVYRDIPENESRYPEFHMFGPCPAYGLYFRHVKGLVCRNVNLRVRNRDIRPAITMDDVEGYSLENFRAERFDYTEPHLFWHKQDGNIMP